MKGVRKLSDIDAENMTVPPKICFIEKERELL